MPYQNFITSWQAVPFDFDNFVDNQSTQCHGFASSPPTALLLLPLKSTWRKWEKHFSEIFQQERFISFGFGAQALFHQFSGVTRGEG